ncbi:alpha/beta hydrolase family protein [Flammeovirga aprica]|uniref:Alpha/beta fold hydrolase n=1 Tax=Flammeovirga aprica JL-4 TaxID=694437 RepID=A0A7X9RWV3_9BACT|nr:alpha/beta fold hydrolase [Flammeovirga aprica]NME70191.1 alpha/beta fold hydrolase [Flammeovirga aprica JL-4]
MKKSFISATILLLLFLFNSTIMAQNLVGPWKGELEIPTGKLTVIFHIKHDNNRFSGTMDVPEQGGKGIPIHSITYQNPFLTIELPNLGIKYVGNVLDDDNIEGTFQQAGASLPLHLKKSLEVILGKPKPQEPQAPFPYISTNVTFQNGNVTLSGTLTRPKENKKYPAVILITGSGPQDRNHEILGHKPFLLLADQLTRSGFAVLRFDDRGTAKSTGEFANSTTYDFADDVAEAFHFLSKRTDIDPQKIGLLGHSEGGIVASITYEKVPQVGFIILMASPGVKGKDLMLLQKKVIDEKSNVPPAVVARDQKIFGEAYDMIVRKEQPLYDRLKEYFKHQLNVQVSDKQIHNIALSLSNPWFTEFIRLDPATYFQKVKCPVLALNGSKDVQVVASQNLPAIESALQKAGNKHFKIVELEGLNHLFQKCETGLPNEYGQIEQTLSPFLLDEIKKWIVFNTEQ